MPDFSFCQIVWERDYRTAVRKVQSSLVLSIPGPREDNDYAGIDNLRWCWEQSLAKGCETSMAVYMVLSRRGAPKVCMNAACITAYQCPRCCYIFQLTSDCLLPAASHLFQQQRCSSGSASDGRDIRMNPLNIKMISKALHKQIFGEETPNVEDVDVHFLHWLGKTLMNTLG